MTAEQVDARQALIEALEKLKEAKPEERNELARRYAIAITELEKVIGYFETFIVGKAFWPE